MTTPLDKTLKRTIAVDGADFTVALDAQGFRLTAKGERKPQVELSWRDLLSGEAALAVALNASLLGQRPADRPEVPEVPEVPETAPEAAPAPTKKTRRR